MIRPVEWTDQDLEDWNDGTATMFKDDEPALVSNNSLNALICEVQAWRRWNSKHKFVSGPNEIVEKEE